MQFNGQIHTSVFTADMETTKAFYRDILMFEEGWSGILPDGTKLAVVQNHDMILELIEPPVYDAPQDAGPVNHIAVSTDDIEEAFRFIREKGYETEGDEISCHEHLFGTGVRNFFFYGPNHERVEIAQMGYVKE